jgi:hypothetical protein
VVFDGFWSKTLFSSNLDGFPCLKLPFARLKIAIFCRAKAFAGRANGSASRTRPVAMIGCALGMMTHARAMMTRPPAMMT